MCAAIEIVRTDITTLAVDAIVNAADNELSGGGGVDEAIQQAGGSALQNACRQIGFCATGKAVITTGGLLPAKFVIHTVGPIWRGGGNGEAAQLKSAYVFSLELAQQHQLASVAFSCISTGVYGYPKQAAAEIAWNAVAETLPSCLSIKRVIFCCFSQETEEIYRRLARETR